MIKAPLNSLRLLIELLVIVAAVEAVVAFLQPAIAPGVQGAGEHVLHALLLLLIVGPLMLWRVKAAARSAENEANIPHTLSTHRLKVMVAMVIAAGVGLSVLAMHQLRRSIHAEANVRFDDAAAEAADEVQRRLNLMVYGIKGVKGLYAASISVERCEFKAYVGAFDLANEFPGALGFGIIQRVLLEDLDDFIAAERADEAPDFRVTFPRFSSPQSDEAGLEPSQHADLYVIKYIYPLEINGSAWGVEIGSDAVRREAIERAIATGEPAITGKIQLVQDLEQHVGLLYIAPVYRNGTYPTTPQERMEALEGLVYAPIVLEKAMADLKHAVANMVDIEIFDGHQTDTATILFDLDGHLADAHGTISESDFSDRLFHTTAHMNVGGRTWTITISTTPTFESQIDETTPIATMVAGMIITLLVAAGLWTLGTRQARELALASAMNQQLRKEAQKSDRLAEIARRTSNSVIVTDKDGRIDWVNEGFTRSTGYTPGEVLGRTTEDILQGPDTDKAEIQRIQAALSALQPVEAELVNYAKSGRRYIVASEINPRWNEAGELAGFMIIQNDVTERREAQEQIESKEIRLRTLVEAADVVLWEYDPSAESFTYVSPQAGRYGYPMEAWLTKRFWAQIIHPEDRARTIADCRLAVNAGQDHRMTYRMLCADGSVAWIEDVVRVQAIDGQVPVLRGVFIDITDRMATQEELKAAQCKAEAANRAKSEFLANMSHEIRTPLTSIIGFTDVLREEGNSETSSQRRLETLDTIKNASNHLLSIINDILDISKIEADKMTVERVQTPLCAILRETASLLRPKASEKALSLQVTLASAVPQTIISDPTRLRQIILNLAGNAVKFNNKGDVSVTASVATEDESQRLYIDIEDTGPGLTEEQSKKLFQAFTQADTSVTRKHGGTGLGLTICRRLAQLMDGSVTLVRSKPGEGTCFRVNLPLVPAPNALWVDHLDAVAPASSKAKTHTSTTIAGRILLAEDGPDNQRLISFHLRKEGATVDIAGNGKIALEMIDKAIAANTPYELLITDIQMPEMDGYTLTKSLRARGNTMSIIALTAHAMADDRQKCLDAGCDDYASKPIDRAALLAVCTKWIHNAKEAQQRANAA